MTLGSGDPEHADVRVPDDASALEPDRQVWLAERRAARRRARLRRLVLTRRWERFGLSGPLVVACLLVTAAVGALAVVFAPVPGRVPEPRPLAQAPELSVPTGSEPVDGPGRETAGGGLLGRLLPPVALSGDAGALTAQDLRPAVLLLVPDGCRCAAAADVLARQAHEFRLPLWMVGQAAAELAALDRRSGAGTARWAVDPAAALARAVGARGLTVVLVRDDGVLTHVRRDVPLEAALVPALEARLAVLARPERSGAGG